MLALPMYLRRIFRVIFSLRLVIVTLFVWLLSSHQSMAWQQGYNSAYPAYAVPVNYNPYNYYPAQPPANRYVAPNYNRRQYPVYNYPAYYRQNYQQSNYYYPQPQPFVQEKNNRQTAPANTQTTKKKKTSLKNNGFVSKQQFIDKLLPYIDQENTRLKRLREQLKWINSQLNKGLTISDQKKTWLKKLARKFRVKANPLKNKQAIEELLTKVDIIPASLTLAQAANESAWGKSRFAKEANNLFGIWTYDQSKGLIPKNRDSDKKHLVRIFENYGESVAYYMHTLNSHPAYSKLREIRKNLRQNRETISGFKLAKGLEKYSAKGDLYIKIIRDLIQQNEWALLDINKQSA